MAITAIALQWGLALGKTLMLTDVMSLADPWRSGAPGPLRQRCQGQFSVYRHEMGLF